MAKQANSEGHRLLSQIIAEAVAHQVDAIEMEWQSGGDLEVMFRSGHSGQGFALESQQGRELLAALYEEKRKGRGRFRTAVHGKDYMVHVATYESFGETAYRLTVRPARQPPKARNGPKPGK